MTVNIQDLGNINAAIEQAFKDSSHFQGWTIERGTFVNNSPDLCPWLGVYRRDVRYETLNLGKNTPTAWEGVATMALILQQAGYDGAEVEDKLEDDIKQALLTVLNADFVVEYVDRVISVTINYSYRDEEAEQESYHFQSAFIEVTLEVANG